MTIIERASQKEHDVLLDIYNNNSNLTLTLEPYRGKQYLNPRNFTDKDKEDIKVIKGILSKKIGGFSSFLNFTPSKRGAIKGEPTIRLEYNYGFRPHPQQNDMRFIGVGYVLIDELLNGFRQPSPGFKN